MINALKKILEANVKAVQPSTTLLALSILAIRKLELIKKKCSRWAESRGHHDFVALGRQFRLITAEKKQLHDDPTMDKLLAKRDAINKKIKERKDFLIKRGMYNVVKTRYFKDTKANV